MHELAHIIRVIPFEELLLLVAVLDVADRMAWQLMAEEGRASE